MQLLSLPRTQDYAVFSQTLLMYVKAEFTSVWYMYFKVNRILIVFINIFYKKKRKKAELSLKFVEIAQVLLLLVLLLFQGF